jgi:hypothetical protein
VRRSCERVTNNCWHQRQCGADVCGVQPRLSLSLALSLSLSAELSLSLSQVRSLRPDALVHTARWLVRAELGGAFFLEAAAAALPAAYAESTAATPLLLVLSAGETNSPKRDANPAGKGSGVPVACRPAVVRAVEAAPPRGGQISSR